MKEAEKRKLGKQLEKHIKRKILSSVEFGDITEKDLRNQDKLWPKIKKSIFGNDIVDHKTSVLEQARKFGEAGFIDFSRVFYAIYFEHLVNRIVYISARHKGVRDTSIKDILRFIGIEGKTTWLLEMFNLPNLNPDHLKVLRTLFEKRNSFIHYKWNLNHLAAMSASKAWNDERKGIERCITYLKKFEAKVVFTGRGRTIKQLVSRLPISAKVGH